MDIIIIIKCIYFRKFIISGSFLSLSMTPEPGACGAATVAEGCTGDGVWGARKFPISCP